MKKEVVLVVFCILLVTISVYAQITASQSVDVATSSVGSAVATRTTQSAGANEIVLDDTPGAESKNESNNKAKGKVEATWKVEEGEASAVDPTNNVGLNPQPEPPSADGLSMQIEVVEDDVQDEDDIGLNPQPEPPSAAKKPKEIVVVGSKVNEPAAKKPKEIVVVGSKVKEGASEQLIITRSTLDENVHAAKAEGVDEDNLLSNLVAAEMEEDPSLHSVVVTEETTTVEYHKKTKVLGLFPVTFKTTVEVTSDGSRVKVKMPWWRSFAESETQDQWESFSLQYIQLQQGMQHESRQFSTLSNIMKAKHDTELPDVQPDPIGVIDTSDPSGEAMKESDEKGGTEDINIGIGE